MDISVSYYLDEYFLVYCLPLEFVLVIKVFKGKVNITAFGNEIASYLQDFYCSLVTLDDSDMDKWLWYQWGYTICPMGHTRANPTPFSCRHPYFQSRHHVWLVIFILYPAKIKSNILNFYLKCRDLSYDKITMSNSSYVLHWI